MQQDFILEFYSAMYPSAPEYRARKPSPGLGITPHAPRSAHGRAKFAGEAVLSQLPDTGHMVRAAWLYGEHLPNFVRTMIRLEASEPTVDVVGRRSEDSRPRVPA